MSYTMDLVEPFAQEICLDLTGKSLAQVRREFMECHRDDLPKHSQKLRFVFYCANILRYYRMGLNPEMWLGASDEVRAMKKRAGLAGDIEEQKRTLIEKGFLREPGEEG